MNPLEQVVLAFQSLAHAVRAAFRPGLWTPWLVVLGLEWMVIACFWWFAHPVFSWFAAPAVQALAGENALRYPNVFRLMPALYGRADLLITAVAGALAIGASTCLFAGYFEGKREKPWTGARRALSRSVPLVLANLPLTLLLVGFSYGLDWWLEEREGPAALRRLAPLLTIAMAVMLQAFFLWVTPLLMLGRRSLLAALAALPRAAARGVWAALTLAFAATVPLLPIQMLGRMSNQIVERGAPEMVGWLVVAQAAIAVATAFVLTGGSTLAYLSLVGPGLDDER